MQPEIQPPTQPTHKMSPRTKTALWLMIAPTALFIIVLVAYTFINLALGMTIPDQDPEQNPQLFNDSPSPVATTLLNSLLFITGGISFLTWLPGLIIGIVLLATQKPAPRA